MPVAFITGCSRGIGRETAVRLGLSGWTVVATLRGEEGRDELEQCGAEVVILDVTDEGAVRREIDAAARRHGRLDALIANAGYGLSGAFELLEPEEVRAVFETNVFGAMACARAALPWLRASQGRLVLLSSLAGRRSAPCSSIYNASKFALEGWGEALRLELAPLGVHVVLIQPGATRTGFQDARRKRAGMGEGPYGPVEARVEQLQEQSSGSADDVALVVDAVERALTARRPPLRIATGRATHLQLTLLKLLPWDLWERVIHRKLGRPWR
jgi:NAD(P)-dependent dehydrogenase (short-subunit alcohol dehydrogenase family)